MPTITYPFTRTCDVMLLQDMGTLVYYTDIVKTITWRRSWNLLGQIATVAFIPMPELPQHLPLAGKFIIRLSDAGEVMRGRNFKDSPVAASITLYDFSRELQESEDDLYFEQSHTPRQAAYHVLNAWGVPIGELADPKVTIPGVIHRNRRLADIIIDAYGRAAYETGNRYSFRFIQDKFHVLQLPNDPEQVDPSKIWKFRRGENIINASSYDRDASKMVTQVKVRGAATDINKPLLSSTQAGDTTPQLRSTYGIARKSQDVINKFGLIQRLVSDSSRQTGAEAQSIADVTLDRDSRVRLSGTFTTFMIPDMWPGDFIFLEDDQIGMNDYVYVAAIDYRIDGSATSGQMDIEWTIEDPMEDWFTQLLQSELAIGRQQQRSRQARLSQRTQPQNIITKLAAEASLTGVPILPVGSTSRRAQEQKSRTQVLADEANLR